MSRTNARHHGREPNGYSLATPENESEPCEAVRTYLTRREREDIAEATIDKHRRQLRQFRRWCVERDITDTAELTARDIFDYENHRLDEVANISAKTDLSTLKAFLKRMDKLNATNPRQGQGLADLVDPSEISAGERRRKEEVSPEAANDILTRLEEYRPYTRDHALFLTLWEGGMRTGGAVALDLEDYNPHRKTLEIRHRPPTTLKNQEKGEREIMVSDTLADVLDGYIAEHRRDKTSQNGRTPLFTTRRGRVSTTQVYRTVRDLTEESEVVRDHLSPHAVRKGAIGRHLSKGWEIQHVAERCNVTERNLRTYYDVRPENEKMRARREMYGSDDL